MTYPGVQDQNLSEGIGTLIHYANIVTNGYFTSMLLISIYIIVLGAYFVARSDFKGGMAVAGFSTLMIAFILFLGGFVSNVNLVITIGVAFIGVVALFFPSTED